MSARCVREAKRREGSGTVKGLLCRRRLPCVKRRLVSPRADAYFTNPVTVSPSSPPAATRARPHQSVHLQPAGFYGRAGAGEHAEAAGPRHLHEDTEGRQRGQQRSGIRQVHDDDNDTVTWNTLTASVNAVIAFLK